MKSLGLMIGKKLRVSYNVVGGYHCANVKGMDDGQRGERYEGRVNPQKRREEQHVVQNHCTLDAVRKD